jgi:hypothetical protein
MKLQFQHCLHTRFTELYVCSRNTPGIGVGVSILAGNAACRYDLHVEYIDASILQALLPVCTV